jgi:hypothetical protein
LPSDAVAYGLPLNELVAGERNIAKWVVVVTEVSPSNFIFATRDLPSDAVAYGLPLNELVAGERNIAKWVVVVTEVSPSNFISCGENSHFLLSSSARRKK